MVKRTFIKDFISSTHAVDALPAAASTSTAMAPFSCTFEFVRNTGITVAGTGVPPYLLPDSFHNIRNLMSSRHYINTIMTGLGRLTGISHSALT